MSIVDRFKKYIFIGMEFVRDCRYLSHLLHLSCVQTVSKVKYLKGVIHMTCIIMQYQVQSLLNQSQIPILYFIYSIAMFKEMSGKKLYNKIQ